jgi:hypothetical protein
LPTVVQETQLHVGQSDTQFVRPVRLSYSTLKNLEPKTLPIGAIGKF